MHVGSTLSWALYTSPVSVKDHSFAPSKYNVLIYYNLLLSQELAWDLNLGLWSERQWCCMWCTFPWLQASWVLICILGHCVKVVRVTVFQDGGHCHEFLSLPRWAVCVVPQPWWNFPRPMRCFARPAGTLPSQSCSLLPERLTRMARFHKRRYIYCIFVLVPLFASLLCSIYLSMIHSVFVSFIGESFHIVVDISFFVNQFYLVFLHVIFSTYEGLPK